MTMTPTKTSNESLPADRFKGSHGAVLLTVVFVLIIIGLVGSAIYSLTYTATYTQLTAQHATRAHYIAESGVRIVAAEYNQAPEANKNPTLESLHNESLTLPDNDGRIDLRVYPYWFYVEAVYNSGDNTIDLKVPGGFPVADMEDPTSVAPLPQSGRLKLQGKTRRANYISSNRTGDTARFNLGAEKFSYDIQPDEEIFLVYQDNTTPSQNIGLEGNNLLLASANPVAQFIPDANGAFRVNNDNNDRMDYTYQRKVVDGVTTRLEGVRSQDPANPSLFPFDVDADSEIFFGKNLAVVASTALGQGLLGGQKTVVTFSDVGLDGGFNIGRENISFEEDIEDFNYPGLPMNDPAPASGDNPIEVDEVAGEINLGGGLNNGYGAVWYGGDSDTANCIEGRCNLGKGFRTYFEFVSNTLDDFPNSKAYGDGFTFAVVSGIWDGSEYRNDKYDTGGPEGEYLGYAGPGLSGDGLRPPKLALELDTYPNLNAGSICGTNSRFDHADPANYPEGANHIALDYWGFEILPDSPGSLDATGGYVRIGSSSPSNGDPEDWSTAGQGTISFWFKRDTILYGNGGTSGDRLWGQHVNMEMRFSSDPGHTLALDWGGSNSLVVDETTSTYNIVPGNSHHPFTVAGKWYFVAITWDETSNFLKIYYGDETSPPVLLAENIAWNDTVVSENINENLFLNSSGGNQSRNFAVDGKGSDLRYYTVARLLTDIQSDFNKRLNGSEPDQPQAYFLLESDFINAAMISPTAGSVGSTDWSMDLPSVFPACAAGNTATRDDNRHGAGGTTQPMNSLNTEPSLGDDGYYQVAKEGTDPYNWMEDGDCYGVRLEIIRPLLPDAGVYKYQLKAWVTSAGAATCDGLAAAYKDTRATYIGTDPQIELTINNGNPLQLAESDHLDLKKILFGFTQATGGATQDITLKNLDMRFIKLYPVADLSTW